MKKSLPLHINNVIICDQVEPISRKLSNSAPQKKNNTHFDLVVRKTNIIKGAHTIMKFWIIDKNILN
jgi:hypothetical protein